MGFGVRMALARLRIGWGRFERTTEKLPGFRQQIRRTQEATLEQLIALRYKHTLDPSHPE
jgi:hypothetical protein